MIHDIGVSVYVMHLPWIAAYNFRAGQYVRRHGRVLHANAFQARFSRRSPSRAGGWRRRGEERVAAGRGGGGRRRRRARLSERFIRSDCAEFSTSHLEKLHLESDTMGAPEAPELHHSRGCHLLKFTTPPFVKRMPRFRIESRCNFERKISRRQITPAHEFASSTVISLQRERGTVASRQRDNSRYYLIHVRKAITIVDAFFFFYVE